MQKRWFDDWELNVHAQPNFEGPSVVTVLLPHHEPQEVKFNLAGGASAQQAVNLLDKMLCELTGTTSGGKIGPGIDTTT